MDRMAEERQAINRRIIEARQRCVLGLAQIDAATMDGEHYGESQVWAALRVGYYGVEEKPPEVFNLMGARRRKAEAYEAFADAIEMYVAHVSGIHTIRRVVT